MPSSAFSTIAILLLLLTLAPPDLAAQRVLLLEKSGQSKAERLLEGESLTYRIRGDKFWQQGVIDELRPDIQAVVMSDRFIMLDEVEALRFGGSAFGNGVGYSLMTFGVGWSAFALVGYATDGDPETAYSRDDLAVTLVGLGTGFLLRKIFARRRFKINNRKRLRIVDLTF